MIKEVKSMIEGEKEQNQGQVEGKEKKNSIDSIVLRQKRQEAFLKSLEGGVSVLKASKEASIDYKTIWNWRKDDKKFNNEVMAILDSRIMIVEDALFLSAVKGNLGAQIFWLKNRAKDRWKDKFEADIDLTLMKGIDYDEFKIIKGMTKDDRRMLIKKLSKIDGIKDDRPDTESQEEIKG